MTAVDARDVEYFLAEEAALLDRGAYEAWINLFTDDGWYWVPAVPGQAEPFDQVSLFFENKPLMKMRAERLQHPRAHGVAAPIRTSRVVGNVQLYEAEGGDLLVRSRFHMAEAQDGRQRVFAGTYIHRLAVTPEGLRIRVKRVDLLNADAPHESMQVFI
jgi:3-phenylpropionate/cinnamic acid dioxygenase small subunit